MSLNLESRKKTMNVLRDVDFVDQSVVSIALVNLCNERSLSDCILEGMYVLV